MNNSSAIIHPDLKAEELSGPVKEMKKTCYKARKKGYEVLPGEQNFNEGTRNNYMIRFNEKGGITEKSYYSKDGSIWKTFFNDNSLETEGINIMPDGSITLKIINIYDDKNHKIEETVTDGQGGLKWKNLYEYDEKGLMTTARHIGSKGVLENTLTYKYDINGRYNESKTVKADGTIQSWSLFDYNNLGYPCKTTNLNPDGSVNSISTYDNKYDEDGHPDNLYWRNKKSKKYRNTFEYDEHKNWIIQTEYYNKAPTFIHLREITYYGEQSDEKSKAHIARLIDSIELNAVEKIKKNKNKRNTYKMKESEKNIEASEEIQELDSFTEDQLKWITEASKVDEISLMRYYVLQNKTLPSVLTYGSSGIEAIAFLEEVKENLDAKVIHSYFVNNGSGEKIQRYTLSFPNKGYLLQATQIQPKSEDSFVVPLFMMEYQKLFDGYVYTSQFLLLRPGDDSELRDEDFEAELEEYIDKCTLDKAPELPEIYMIEATGGGSFSLEGHTVNDNFIIKNLDLHYGYGFEKFHNELMGRFKNETKGLILFHGEPGTGKTYYIRHLLRKMASNDKVVIYMPPNMVDYLIEPGFLTFLSREITNFSSQGYFCAMLIEDAEPLLAARQEGRIQGVSNLLNMTDGLLNDMLNLQIICTFNVNLKELDKALLRPGRLIARKEFKAMPALDANILAKQLGINHHFTKSTTIAEVFAMLVNKTTLLHGIWDSEEEM